MRLLAPAKLNLHLRVGSPDASGFHPLMSWLCTVGLFDTLTITPGASAQIVLTCDDPALACDEGNLVVRAAQMLPGDPGRGASISLQKSIPVGAGLGGGSSDAARALLGLNRLWDLKLPVEQLHDMAATLGSDVPFFLHGHSSICTGRGQYVKPIAVPRVRSALLILSSLVLPTAQVYRAFDQLRLRDVGNFEQPDWQEWAALSAGPLLSRLVNDLEPAAFALRPQLGRLRDALEASLGRVIRMTGSGSTLFTLFDSHEQAESAVAVVAARHRDVRAVAIELAPLVEDDLSNV